MPQLKIGIINPTPKTPLDSDYGYPFRDHGSVQVFYHPHTAVNYNIVVFPGGPDVDPSLYGEKPHPQTRSDIFRDSNLKTTYKVCLKNNIPMVGICGGMQFLSVVNGLKINQHIEHHRNTHHELIIRNTEHKEEYPQRIVVNSDHHQEVYIPEKTYPPINTIVLAYTPESVIEAIWFPKTKSLGVQFHPEWMPKDSEGYEYFQHLLKTYIL